MRKAVSILVVAFVFIVTNALAAELKVGDKVPDFKLKDADGKAYYTLNSPRWAGKVRVFVYASALHADDNVACEEAFKAANLDGKLYEGIGMGNLQGDIVPNFIIKKIAKAKQEKNNAVILMDEDQSVLKAWGLKDKASNVIVVDKNGVCRYIYRGKLPSAEVAKELAVTKACMAE